MKQYLTIEMHTKHTLAVLIYTGSFRSRTILCENQIKSHWNHEQNNKHFSHINKSGLYAHRLHNIQCWFALDFCVLHKRWFIIVLVIFNHTPESKRFTLEFRFQIHWTIKINNFQFTKVVSVGFLWYSYFGFNWKFWTASKFSMLKQHRKIGNEFTSI